MMRYLPIITLFGALLWSGSATASTAQAIEKTAKLCSDATAKQEQRDRIPRHLLNAISLAETGRWNTLKRASFAWPWTVTAGGEGMYFDTKAEALAEVELLLTEGVRNIDVGCMQINLFYHAGAFETLSKAFEPAANAAYASRYLRSMYDVTGDWKQAVGFYHSTTPERAGPYAEKVVELWNRQGGDANRYATRSSTTTIIDHDRTAELNAAMKTRRELTRKVENAAARLEKFAFRRHAELNAWREAKTRNIGLTHFLAMRRAEQKLREKKKLAGLDALTKAGTFAEKRRQQLNDWRLKVVGTDG